MDLSVFGVLCSVVAAYYYIRIIKIMFFDEPAAKFDGHVPFVRQAILGFSIAFMLLFIFNPSPLLDISRDAVSVFFHYE